MAMRRNIYQALDLACDIFFGDIIWIGDKCSLKHYPARLVRDAVKYVSLDEKYRKIWDDPNMLPAHKYQNIPQFDISTYRGDYRRDVPEGWAGAFGLLDHPFHYSNGKLCITYVEAATKEQHKIEIDIDSALHEKFITMARIDKIAEDVEGNHFLFKQKRNMIFSTMDRTHMLVDGTPSYNVTIGDLAEAFEKHPSNLQVPYRRGWSRVLNISPVVKDRDRDEFMMIYNGNTVARMLDSSCITHWDGTSMRIENHGVEVEDMSVEPLQGVSGVNHMVRRLEETHEYMRNVSIVRTRSPIDQYYVIYAAKGININGFEFEMA